jgi:hypothetical protein
MRPAAEALNVAIFLQSFAQSWRGSLPITLTLA